MGAFKVQELPFPVTIKGESPTPEEAGDIISVVEDYQANPDKYAHLKPAPSDPKTPDLNVDMRETAIPGVTARFGSAKNPQNKVDVSEAFSGNASGIDRLTENLPGGFRQIARAALKVPSDVAQNYALPLATMPYKIGKELFNAATLPVDVYDRLGDRTDYGRHLREALPEVETKGPTDLGAAAGSMVTGMGALGQIGKLGALPKIAESAGALTQALGRTVGGALVGTAVTDPDRPTVMNMIPGIRNYASETGHENPALDNRLAHFTDQLGAGAALEGAASLLPTGVKIVRDAAQGLFGNNRVESKTAQGVQAALGGADKARAVANDLANKIPLPGEGIPGVRPTTADILPDTAFAGMTKRQTHAGSAASNERQAPSTILRELDADNLAAAKAYAAEGVPDSPDVAAPLAQKAKSLAGSLEGARNNATADAQKVLDDAANRAEAEVAGRKKMAADDAATAQADLDAEHAALPQYPDKAMGAASKQVAGVIDSEFTRLRNAKNDAYDALRTDQPVTPNRIATTLQDIFTPPSQTSRVVDELTANPTVMRIKALVEQQDPKKSMESLARSLAEDAARTSEAYGAVNTPISRLSTPEAREQAMEAYARTFEAQAARMLGIADPANPVAMAKLTTTDLIDATPYLSAAIAKARNEAATNATQGELSRRLVALKRAMSIRSPEDVQALLGAADPAYQGAAQNAIDAFQTYASRFKQGVGRDISIARAKNDPVPPTAVLPRYLGNGGNNGFLENATQLIDTINGARDPAVVQKATEQVRDWLVAALASHVPESGKLTPQVVREFRKNWIELIDQMPPSIQGEFDGLLQRVGDKQAQVGATKARLKAAEGLKPEDIEVPRPGVDPTLNDLRTRVEQAAKVSPEEVAINQLGDKMGKDPVAAFAAGMEHARPLSADGIGPLLKLASTDAQKDALKGIASMHMKQLLGDDLSGAAKMLADPMKRAALAKVFPPAEMARLDLVNSYALGRKSIANVPSTGAFPTLKEPESNIVKSLWSFFATPGRVGKVASMIKDSAFGGDSKAVAEKALMDVLTNPTAALRALRLDTKDEGAIINFMKSYADQALPLVSSTAEESLRRHKEE